MDCGRKERHEHNSRVFQKRNRAGGRAPEAGQLRRHDKKIQPAHHDPCAQSPLVDPAQTRSEADAQEHKRKQKPQREQEYLKYTITEDLEFVIVEDSSLKIKNINENNLKLGSEISFKRFTKKDYKKSIDLCEHLLMRVRDSFYNLDEIEKYIIKNFEYDKPKPLTDEIIIFETKIHKDKYYRSKKSAYIKMALQLGLMDEIKMDTILVSELKKYISKNIITIEN